MSKVLVRVRDVGKSFRLVRAVDSVSFEVNTGEIFALLGPNGAGKSTLVRMMIGMLPPDQGVIQWYNDNELPISLDTTQIGYLPEDRGLYRDQKVKDILEYFGQLRGMSVLLSRGAAQDWARRLEVSEYMDEKLETLSKGNQQKVQVAAAVLHRPRLALLDEPFSGLDPINQEMMLKVIRCLRDEGTTVILSAHQLELVERLADRVFLLAKGRRVLAGTVPEIKSGVHGGYSLRITFASPPETGGLQAWQDSGELTGFQRLADDTFHLTLKGQNEAARWMEQASRLGDVVEFRGGTLSLHEIYLSAIGTTSDANAVNGQHST